MATGYEIAISGKAGDKSAQLIIEVVQSTLYEHSELIRNMESGHFVIVIDDPMRSWREKEQEMYPSLIEILKDEEFIILSFLSEDGNTEAEMLTNKGLTLLASTPLWMASKEALVLELEKRETSLVKFWREK